jgi:hypothetical protein
MHGKIRNAYKILVRKTKWDKQLGDQEIERRTILKVILKK